MISYTDVNNPRQSDGDFGIISCNRCGGKSSAYVGITLEFPYTPANFTLCKSCLLEGIDIIDKTTLQDCVKKGKERHGR